MNNPVSFIPVRTTEERLNSNINVENGYLYFTTDSQKIYLGMPDGKKLSMGGNTGIYYGKKEIDYPTDGNQPDPQVIFTIDDLADESEIEGSRLPSVNDLILNIDGCFYRTMEILDENSVLTNRITLQGTGIGGGEGTGAPTFSIGVSSATGGYYSSGATSIPVNIIARSSDKENFISLIECSFDNLSTAESPNIFLIKNVEIPVETTYSLDLISQKNQFNENKKKVYVRVTDKYGSVRVSSLTIAIATLEIATNEEKMLESKSLAPLSYTCSISGTSGITKKQLEYRFYNKDGIELSEYTQYHPIEDSQSGSVSRDLNVSSIPHGSYELRVVLTGSISGAYIESNVLVHKFIRYDSNIAQPIFSYLVPESKEQYTDIPIQYLLTFGEEAASYVMDIIIDDEITASQTVTTGKTDNYVFSFDRTGTYRITFRISNLNIEETFNLTIAKYTGILPVINMNDDSLKVYLNPKGRTNSSADKEYWPDYKNSTMKASLNNFYYRNINGWMVDDDGVNYLKLTQGASAELLAYSPFDNAIDKKGLTIELDFMINGIVDYDANFIECLSRNNDNSIKTGFVVQGDSFKYYADSAEKPLFSLNLVQGKRIRLSVVIEPKTDNNSWPMCYCYLNGIISNVVSHGGKDFKNSTKKGYLKFNSVGGEVNIYGIRIYDTSKEDAIVLNNYQASLSSLEERQASYEGNAIVDTNKGNIVLSKIENDYPLQIPYVKIVGGFKADKTDDGYVMSDKASDNVQALPTGKKDYRVINIEVFYPTAEQNEYFAGYENFSLKTTFEASDLNEQNGFGNLIKTGAIMYAQGTSSLEYPVKNLRVKLKGGEIKVRPDLPPVDLICFKADFMESSGSHNTGAANFIDTAYEKALMKTPAQKHFEDEQIVTCIKGHPCVIFWSKTGEPGSFEYIGKYNLNLDKATPEPFGFKNDDSKFGYLTDEDGNYIDNDGNIVNEENKQNSIFCFEFLDNNVKVCNFLSDEISASNVGVGDKKTLAEEKACYEDTWYGERKSEENVLPGWRIGFESRYPEDKESREDADVLYPLASWLNELYFIYTEELNAGKKPTEIEYNYEYQKAAEFDENAIYFILTDNGYEIAFPNKDNFIADYYFTRTLKNKSYTMTSIQRFRDEYKKYLDTDFLLAYYIITEALLMADSRVKNMMIATWGKERRTFTKDDGSVESVYDYIWYPIFYDMDTMLGLDNAGVPNKNYYDEDTTEETFNGDEVLWKLVRDSLPNEIDQFYNRLEQAGGILTKNAILPFFNDNQANLANETFYNKDAYYKYINTFRTGYRDDLHEIDINPGEGERLYAAQGNRSMMREWFLDNRIKYTRGKHSSTNYQSGDRIEFRLTYPKWQDPATAESETERIRREKINASIAAVPPSGNFEFTSMKTGFAGVKIGKNSTPTSKRFEGEKTQIISIDTSSGNGTETYLLGVSNLSSIGDLSDKYLYRLVVGAAENNLKQLILGNHKPDYYNPFWSNENQISLTSFRYLEEFNLENCGTFAGTIDFSTCPQIKKILLNGSETNRLVLPVSGVLEELRLPTTVKDINIDSHPTLDNSNFTIGYYDYENNKYVNDFTHLTKASIIGCPEIDSYKLVCDATIKHPGISNFEYYCFKDFNWIIEDANDLEYSENNTISKIKILEELKNKSIYHEDMTRAESLVGNIYINVNAAVNEFEIYQLYKSIFPNLTIAYGDKVTVDKASLIEFYNIEVYAEDAQPYYTVLSNNNSTLSYLTSINGPAGKVLTPPKKLSTNEYDFEFSQWMVVYSEDSNYPSGTIIKPDNFVNIVPKGDMKLVPEYKSNNRLYEIILYDYDGTTILVEEHLQYNANIGESLREYSKSYYNYRPYTGDKEHYRYEFKGWQSEYDFSNNPKNITYSNLNNNYVSGKIKLYAYYAEEDCQTTVSNLEFFNIKGDSISIKKEYVPLLKGKITFPGKDSNGNYLKTITKDEVVQGNNGITYIYIVDKDAQYETIGDNAFDKYSALVGTQILELPSLKNINIRSFGGCSELTLNKLPVGLEIINGSGFGNCSKLKIDKIGTVDSAPNLKYIGSMAFGYAGKSVSKITIGNNQYDENINNKLEIVAGAFTSYGASKPEVKIYTQSLTGAKPEEYGFINAEFSY